MLALERGKMSSPGCFRLSLPFCVATSRTRRQTENIWTYSGWWLAPLMSINDFKRALLTTKLLLCPLNQPNVEPSDLPIDKCAFEGEIIVIKCC